MVIISFLIQKSKSTLFFFLGCFFGFAQIPAYYDPANLNTTGENLKVQLAQLITETQFAVLSYTPGVWNALKLCDVAPENSSRVLLLYGYNDNDGQFISDRTRNINSTCNNSNCFGFWNREHVFPRSLGNPNLGYEGPGSDAHHLRPTDFEMNSLRSNRRFTSGSGNAGVVGSLFYPGDEWKGDVARMVMYMYLRYGFQTLPNNVGSGSSSISPLNDMPNIFLQWNAEDPPAAHELTRNNVLENLQGNRNPFIDNPYLATLIWGGPTAQDNWDLLSIQEQILETISVYPTSTQDFIQFSDPKNVTMTFEIFALNGQKICEGPTATRINLSNFEKGFYFLKINIEDSFKVFKIIKE
ncbi:MAG: endonuclease [Flavobacterium sp.]